MIDQGEFFDIPSPCVGICAVNNRGYCKGCLRNRQERFHWNDFTLFQKQQVINLCSRRRQKILDAKQQANIIQTATESVVQQDLFNKAITPPSDSPRPIIESYQPGLFDKPDDAN